MKTINGQKLKEILSSGINNLINNKDRIDTLNVFPVPDGDTGSNMSSTVEYAEKEISLMEDVSIEVISSKFARGMLMGARGNSGVILSQIFKGFSMGFEGKETANPFDIIESFKQAKIYAYKSVMQPVEGTILTVIKVISEELENNINGKSTIEETFDFIFKIARKTTNETPELLPILKEVGVVDSGGEGLTVFLEGINLALKNKPIKLGLQEEKGKFGNFFIKEDYEGELGYCTEFIVELKNSRIFNKEKFEKTIMKHGNSMVVVHDNNIIKVHIHSLAPGKILTLALEHGELLKIKIDNMTIQANESNSAKKEMENKSFNKVTNNLAIISCNTGQGIIKEMKDLGTHFIIEAGQTLNPSAKDLMKAIEETGASKIIILPNNSNIILAAQQVAQTSLKEVLVIPTKTQMQGISAVMNFNSEGTLQENQENMEEAIKLVKTGQVTKCSRTTKIEGVSVKKGEYLAIAENKILKSTTYKTNAAIEISKKLIDENIEIVTIYYGDNSTKTDAEEISSYIENNFDVEIEIKSGDQRVYDFLISYE